MNIRILLLLLALATAGCLSNEPQQAPVDTAAVIIPAPVAGETIAIDSMKVTDDNWHDYHFILEIASTDKQGVYSVLGTWGLFLAESSFTMPRGGRHLAPVLRRGTTPYTYHIGFYKDGDTAFHEYYEVKGQRGQIKMKYVKAYSIEAE